MTKNEKLLTVCEIAGLLGRSEKYVYKLKAMPGAPFIANRAYFSDVLDFLKRTNPHPCKRKKICVDAPQG